jgi:exopolysaccharide biosynthesis polyprenyl glycosylphosphotransferase
VFAALSQTVVDVQLIADLPAMAGMTFATTEINGMTVIGLRENPHYGLSMVVKRAMDLLLSSVAIVLLAPLMGALALAIKLTSPGPVLYRQERCGLNGRSFMMLKFRTMSADAEKGGPQMTTANDPRRTRLGTFLRKTNLDELPQFWNVLKGEMSLVGPRPERQHFINAITELAPHYRHLHKVRPGITSWGQVKFGYAENVEQMVRRLKYDILYIENMSLAVDLKILAYTVLIIFKGDGK